MSATRATQQAQNTAIPRRVIGAVVATGIMSFCGVIVETAMNITFPALMSHFGIGTSSVQWMTTLYLLVVASITPLSAALKRRFRSRTLFLCANLLFLTGLVIDALAPVFPLLLPGRDVQGLGTINGSQHALILLLIIGGMEALLTLAALLRSQKPQCT